MKKSVGENLPDRSSIAVTLFGYVILDPLLLGNAVEIRQKEERFTRKKMLVIHMLESSRPYAARCLILNVIPERFLFLWTGEFMKELC